jgi:hypothetical protein
LSCLELWWKHAPQSFSVVKDAKRRICGFDCVLDREGSTPELSGADPVLQNWLEHLRAAPVPATQNVAFFRRWLSSGRAKVRAELKPLAGSIASALICACVPTFAGFTVRDHLTTYGPVLGQLGFQVISSADATLDGNLYHTAMLDFGTNSVDGWLARFVAAELGVNGDELLDVKARELVIDGQRLPLTPLEFSVMRYLHEREGSAVARESLLRDVGGTSTIWAATWSMSSCAVFERSSAVKRA